MKMVDGIWIKLIKKKKKLKKVVDEDFYLSYTDKGVR